MSHATTGRRPGLRRSRGFTLRSEANFLKDAGPLRRTDLPVASHELIARCAPRHVFFGAGTLGAGDGWCDPRGMFLAEVGAGPVHRLLGEKDPGTADFPPVETRLIAVDHVIGPNWPTFLGFAVRHLGPR